MISFHKNNVYFFLLQTILFSFVIAVISNYGGSVQIASVINQRFLTILAIIPALHLAIVFLNNNFLNFKSIFLSILQLLILIFFPRCSDNSFIINQSSFESPGGYVALNAF